MKKTEEKREKSKKLLVETALSLFSEKGYEATSIRNIASEAGVSLGLMYNYFNSKEELLLEIFRLSNEDIQGSFAKTGKPHGTSPIRQHIVQTVALLKEKKHFWRLLHSLRFKRGIMAPIAQEVRQQIVYVEAQLKENLEEAGVPAPGLEAKLLFASIDGMAMHYLLNENYPIDDVAELLIQKYTTH